MSSSSKSLRLIARRDLACMLIDLSNTMPDLIFTSSVTSDDPAILFPQTPITTNPTVSAVEILFLFYLKRNIFPDCHFAIHRKVTWFHVPSYNSLVCQRASRAKRPKSHYTINPDSSCCLVRFLFIMVVTKTENSRHSFFFSS